MSKSQKSPATVDYPATIAGCRTMSSKAATSYKAWSRQEGSKTMVAVHATRASVHSGYLAADGRDPGRDPASKTRQEYANLFGVTPAQVTFWRNLGIALDAGIVEDSPLFAVVLLGRKMARRSKIAEALPKGEAATVEALQAEGIDPITGERKPKAQGPRLNGSGKDEGTEDADTPPVTAEEQVHAALKALAEGLKALPVESADWAKPRGYRALLVGLLRREDTLRGVGPAKVTAKGLTKGTAKPKAGKVA